MTKKKRTAFGILLGAVIGAANGLLGGGGGMLAVPALSALGLSARQSHATAILVILPISVVSAIVYIAGGQAEWDVLWSTGLGVIAGGALGAVLLSRLKGAWIRVLFALIMIAVGLKQAVC